MVGAEHCAEQSDLVGCVRDAELARIAQLQMIGSPTLPVSPPTQATAPANPPGPAGPAPPMGDQSLVSLAVGMSLDRLNPTPDCWKPNVETICDFGPGEPAPQSLCPPLGRCDQLEPITKDGVVTGWRASF